MNEIPKHKNTVFISHSIIVQKNIKASFDFIINDLTKVYAQLSKGHEYFKTEIGIQFSSFFEKFFSQLFGGLIPWKKHCIEEMESLKNVLCR